MILKEGLTMFKLEELMTKCVEGVGHSSGAFFKVIEQDPQSVFFSSSNFFGVVDR